MRLLLQSHPLICGGEESHFFNLFGGPLSNAEKMTQKLERRVGPLSYLSQDEFEDLFIQIWVYIFHRLYAENPSCTTHLEKTPFHALSLDQIKQIFPDAKIIFLARDSRAVTSSLVQAGRSWGNSWAPHNYRGAALEWNRHVRAIRDWRSRNPNHPFLQVHYEDVLVDTRGELEKILRFLLPGSENLQINATIQALESSEATLKDPEGFSRKRGAEGWKTDMPTYGKLLTWRYTRKLMKELGYDISIFD